MSPFSLYGAISVGAKVVQHGDQFYAALRDCGRWNVWRLELDSPIYYPDPTTKRCTCPVGGSCKHLDIVEALQPAPKKPADKRRGK